MALKALEGLTVIQVIRFISYLAASYAPLFAALWYFGQQQIDGYLKNYLVKHHYVKSWEVGLLDTRTTALEKSCGGYRIVIDDNKDRLNKHDVSIGVLQADVRGLLLSQSGFHNDVSTRGTPLP